MVGRISAQCLPHVWRRLHAKRLIVSSITGRELVLTALDHEEPDRLTMIFGGNLNTSMAHQAYERLKAALRAKGPVEGL